MMILKLSRALIGIAGAALLAVSASWSPAAAQTPFTGQIQFFPYNFAPRDWSFCNGQLLPIANNTALFSLLGTTFGGDGRTTMGLPDMRGRAPLHPGTGPGLPAYRAGQMGGVEQVTLTVSEMPPHNHGLNGTNTVGDQKSPAGNTLARDGRDQTYRNEAPNVTLIPGSIVAAGGGQAHENMQPYLALNCNIALNGLYPSRP